MKVSLLFPPQWTAAQPYFALALLNGQLRQAGYEVSIWDLNLEFTEEMLGERVIRRGGRRLRSERELLTAEAILRLAIEDRSERLRLVARRLHEVESVLASFDGEGLVRRAASALRTFRDRELFYDPNRLADAFLTLDEVLRLASAPYHPAEIRWNDFANPLCKLNFEPILEFCRSQTENLFRPFYERWLPAVLAEQPGLIAISISSFSQLLPGLTLAEMAKEALAECPGTHLCLGGNFFSRLREVLCRRPEFFRAFADSVVMGEGERPIVALAHALAAGADGLERVPNMLFLDPRGEVGETGTAPPPRMDRLAFQDFAGFSLGRYLAPERVACVRSSKGCYWSQCAFCDAHHGQSRDSVEVERLVGEVLSLRDRYGIRHFEFIDECIDPRYLSSMCDAFIEADLDIRWFCNARTEPGFTPALLEKMSQAGATMILWGIESASPRLLHLMRKGVSAEGRLSLLRCSAEAGIWNFAYIFFGFPSETKEEAEATIDLICENTDSIHSYGRSVFTLGKHSPLILAPERYGILKYVEDDQEYSTNLSYESVSGIQGRELASVGRRCTERCRRAYGNPLWMALRSRETLHLFLARHGLEYVRDCHLEPRALGQPGFMF